MSDAGYLTGINHVNLSMPVGQESVADRFYNELLGLAIKAKPAENTTGRWYVGKDFEVHLGSDKDFLPAQRAHPAFNVDRLAELMTQLDAAGFDVKVDAGDAVRRGFVFDPFGNRIELIAASH